MTSLHEYMMWMGWRIVNDNGVTLWKHVSDPERRVFTPEEALAEQWYKEDNERYESKRQQLRLPV